MDKKDIIIAELHERIRQLEALLVVEFDYPVEWYLSPNEITIFARLLARDVVSRDSLHMALYSAKTRQAELKIVDVFIHNLRKKLKPFGVQIEKVWGIGYALKNREKWRAELCHD